MGALIRLAAAGDLHFGPEQRGRLRPHLVHLPARADLLLLAGDLTQRGTVEEGEGLAEELADLGLPVIAVLGNHDYHGGREDQVRLALERTGVHVLEGESILLDVAGMRLGVAGAKGFCGGFAGACGAEFGELEMKSFIRHTKVHADRLTARLQALQADVRIALLHYAPVRGTLTGEKPEIYPFLGSYLLGEAVDHGGAHLAIHGHAHHGVERGITPGGVPVRNVAQPVLGFVYQVYRVERDGGRPTVTT